MTGVRSRFLHAAAQNPAVILASSTIAVVTLVAAHPAAAQLAGVTLGESVRINGYTSAHFETTNQQRFGSLIPDTRFRWELAPTVFVRGVPISLNAMYSTEDNTIGRTVSGFSLSLNLGTDELEQIVRQRIDSQVSSLASEAAGATGADDVVGDVQEVAATAGDTQQTAEQRINQLLDLRDDLDGPRPSLSQLQDMGLLTAQERLAMRFPALGIGTTYPQHSPYTLNGIAVNGVNIDFAPGSVFLSGAAGRVRDPQPFTNRFVPGVDSVSYDRSAYGARVGVGRPDGRHFLVSGTYFADETTSDSLLLFAASRPEENVIAAISSRWSDAQRRVTVHGEVAASVYTQDRQGAEIAEVSDLPVLENLVTVNSTTSGDYAGGGEVNLRLREQALKVDASYDHVGAGFVTLGNPLLRNDLRRIGAGFEKQFSRRQVGFAAKIRHEKSNLSGFQPFTTTSRVINTRLNVRFRGKPYATIQFVPSQQRIESEGVAIPFVSEYNSNYLTVAAGHRYDLGETVNGNTDITVANQQTSSDGIGFDYATTVISVVQGVTISRFTVTALASFFRQRDTDNPLNSNVFDVGVTVMPIERVTTTVGVSLFDDIDRSNESGLYAAVSADAGALGTLYARVETSRYTDELFDANSFNQTTLTASLMRRW